MPESINSSTRPDPNLWITILAGGSGTRFWPVSTPQRPKQLLPLAGEKPLIQETVERAQGIVPSHRIRILTGGHLSEPFRAALKDMDPVEFLVEPRAKGTAPVLTWAAWTLLARDPDATIVSLHADHAIEPQDAFQELIRAAGRLAKSQRKLFTVAVPPTRPETGYGYIRPGDEVTSGEELEAFHVEAFVEKPDRSTAEEYLQAGYLWNSGIFIWRADVFLEEVAAVCPELNALLPLLEEGDVEGFFEKAPNISVDHAILERSRRVASVRATFGWDDVGSWEALSRTRERDRNGNVILGRVFLKDATDNIAMAEEGELVLFGVEGLVVVRSGDVVLVARRERTPDLKTLLEELPSELRDPGSK